MAKIYTKTGDGGLTGLFGGGRVPKNDVRIEAYGAVDELNAVLGWARTEVERMEVVTELDAGDRPRRDVLAEELTQVQRDLFSLGAELATVDPHQHGTLLVDAARVAALETSIDAWETILEPLTAFILPGGTAAAAALHVARTVCRRAERRTLALADAEGLHESSVALVYLNRLSDLLFVMARVANRLTGERETDWHA